MKKAKFIRKVSSWTSDARLYELSSPISYTVWDEDEEREGKTKFVIVSAVIAFYSGPETYIFASNEEGAPLSWTELEGSFRGGLDHEKALSRAGFKIVDSLDPDPDPDQKPHKPLKRAIDPS